MRWHGEQPAAVWQLNLDIETDHLCEKEPSMATLFTREGDERNGQGLAFSGHGEADQRILKFPIRLMAHGTFPLPGRHLAVEPAADLSLKGFA